MGIALLNAILRLRSTAPEGERLAPSVASEELARRGPTEKAELAVANEHFSVGTQQRQIQRSSSEQVRWFSGASPR